MEAESWTTLNEIRAALDRYSDSIPGWVKPAAYGVGAIGENGLRFPVVNSGAHALPAVVLASVIGRANGTGSFRFNDAQFDEAIAALIPAEACTDEQHPNLWAWRDLRASADDEYVAVYVESFDDPAVDSIDRAFRRQVRSAQNVWSAGSWQALVGGQLRRVERLLDAAIGDMSESELAQTVGSSVNTILWLAWHLTRSHDRNISEFAGWPQLWTDTGWHERFRMPADPADTGYEHTPEQVAALPSVTADTMLAYHDAVMAMAERYLNDAPADDLARLVMSPTFGTSASINDRMISVVDDGFEHLGQIRIA